MPTWWSKKPVEATEPPLDRHLAERIALGGDSWKHKGKAKSLDDVFGRRSGWKGCSPPAPSSPSSSSGFDSDGGGSTKRGHPLPRPSTLSAASCHPYLGMAATGSGSVSSLSSSGSDETIVELGSRGGASETQCSPGSRNSGPTSTSCSPLSSSSLLPHLTGLHLNFSSARQEEEEVACHPLPLPPGSLTSSSHAFTNSGSTDADQRLRSKWKKGKLLGRGTFGHVYLGFNCENGNMCAIKEVGVIPDDQNSKESLKQLNQEIALLGQLSHPNIVQYYGSEMAEESLSVYLEYVSGGSIHKLLKEYGPFEEPVIRSYAKQILSGLSYLHERNTVHRDIKGANILVDPNGGIKLADFGMAKHINSCTNALSFKGSPHWMAPEVVMNTNGYNLAVDIWSLGCTVLEMATSKAPWSQFEGVAAVFKIGNSNDIPEIPEHLSDDGKNFLKLCLQRNPSARPTAAQLLEHPFVKEYTSAKVVGKNKISKGLFHSSDKGVCLPREISHPHEQEYDIKHRTAYSNVRLQSRCSGIKGVGAPSPDKWGRLAKEMVSVITYLPKHTFICQIEDFMYQGRSISHYLMNMTNKKILWHREKVHPRLIMSLPVSPCSSPLRQIGASSYGNRLSSPPHPKFVAAGFNFDTYPIDPPRSRVNQTRKSSASSSK